MQTRTERVRVRFASGDVECVAWHYPGTNGACVVMAAGGAVTKGFSLTGGHVFRVAARHPRLGAAVAQTPLVDGVRGAAQAGRHQRPLTMLRVLGLGILDTLGGLAGRRPLLIPLAGEPGTVAMLTTPDGLDGDRALNPGNRYPEWLQMIAARSGIRISLYRPGLDAPRITGPLLVLVADQDQTAPAELAVEAAKSAPHADIAHVPGGHYAPFLDAHEQAVDTQLRFLRKQLLAHGRAPGEFLTATSESDRIR
ncbi:hypothetical protein ACFXPS_06805 [Nocardia sp. NPDC059091]|uniref:hypothetical protein n=1 Tax=unclassified Nocardia TaxID=2637762 RepID=UPI0036A3D867